jgi:exocyst complex component 2
VKLFLYNAFFSKKIQMTKPNSPVVTGISPNEATPGTKITIRGENFGTTASDMLGINILGADCMMTAEWKSPNKIVALCPPRDGKGDIIIATISGGLGTCNVSFRAYTETIGPLKEVASWTNEKFISRRKTRRSSPDEQDDPLGLHVEERDSGKISEEQLQLMFPEACGNIGGDNFEPGYFLLESHRSTTFEDLKAGVSYLKRKVDGENESQLSFIKSNVSSIVDQLDTLRSIKKRYEIDNNEYGRDPTVKVEKSIEAAKIKADQMFFDVLGRKDRADATRNALNVMNRFKFLFFLPANIEANIAKGDFDRVIDEYERARNLYGDTDSEIFQKYLDEIEKGVAILHEQLGQKLKDDNVPLDQQKRLIANLVQLNSDQDPAWESIQINYTRLLKSMDTCRDDHLTNDRKATSLPKPILFPTSPSKVSSSIFPTGEADQAAPPEAVLFIEDITDRLAMDLPDLWKLGQAYFKGDLVVEPDAGKSAVFKEMILGGIRYFANLIRAAVIPQTFKKGEDVVEYGDWGHDGKKVGQWLPSCLRHVRITYSSLVQLDLPSQALDIVKALTTDLRIQCLQVIFQTVIDEVHLLHEKEEWKQEITDKYGAITELPSMFATIVSESVQLIKEALMSGENGREEDLLSYKNAHADLELLIQSVLSSFAFALENAALEEYHSETSYIPPETTRLVSLQFIIGIRIAECIPSIKISLHWALKI